jgi:acyl carrier protein
MTDDRRQLLTRVTAVFREVFDDDQLELTEDLTPADLEAWTSLAHITLCLALEDEFNLCLNPKDISGLSSVGAILDFLGKGA